MIVPLPIPKTRVISANWKDHYCIPENSVAKRNCIHCGTEISINKTSAQSEIRHLKNLHADVYVEPSKKLQSTLSIANKLFETIPPFSNEKLISYLVDFVVENNEPFAIVESESFRRLLKFCQPQIINRKAETVRKAIITSYERSNCIMQSMFATVTSAVSCTTDLWTSPNNRSYMATTIHWIDEEWKARRCLLGFKEIVEIKHSGVTLAGYFLKTLEEFGVQHKLLCITMDNASVNDTLASTLETFLENLDERCVSSGLKFLARDNRIHCSAHVLHLACTDALNEFQNQTKKLRTAVKNIRSSPQQEKVFACICESIPGSPDRKPILDVRTRWNSLYDMLNSCLDFKTSFERYSLVSDNQSIMMNAEEWNTILSLKTFLKVFADVSMDLISSSFETLSEIVPYYEALLDHCVRWENMVQVEEDITKAATASKMKLLKYYNKLGITSHLAAILDPRTKLSYNNPINREDINVIFDAATSKYVDLHRHPENDNIKKATGIKNKKPKYGSELDRYLETDVENDEVAMLLWWKSHAKDYPVLCRIARDYLAIPSTSVCSERSFSAAKLLISDLRGSLKSDIVEASLIHAVG